MLVAVGVGVLVGRAVAVGQSSGVGVLVGRGVAVGRGVGDEPGDAVGVAVRVGRGVRVALGVAVGGCPAAQDAVALAVVPSSQRMLKLTEITPLMLQPGLTSTTF